MGLFDFFSSTRRPAAGQPVLPAQTVREKLLAINRTTAPFHLLDGTAEGVDVIAEWKIVDAKWHEIFAQAGLSKAVKIYLRLDESTHEVRAMDRELSIEWRVGIPSISFKLSAFRGQQKSIEFGREYGFKENHEFGEIYSYHFNTRELKQPIQTTVTECGWTYKAVAFGKL
jgi:hypothetical protein